jgi:hypothetical protein
MSAYHVSLPSSTTMKSYCHLSHDRLLPIQAFYVLILLSAALFVLFSLPAALAGAASFIMGIELWNGDIDALDRWLRSTLSYSIITASTLIALGIFVKTYMRTQFGPPAYYSELEVDLSKESVVHLCIAYMHGRALDEVVQVDESSGRLVGLMRQNSLSSTFLEIMPVVIDQDRTRIVISGASVLYGKAALLDAFYVDLGASRDAASKMGELFSPYGSRRRHRGTHSNIRVIPLLRPVEADCPPPLLKHAHQYR